MSGATSYRAVVLLQRHGLAVPYAHQLMRPLAKPLTQMAYLAAKVRRLTQRRPRSRARRYVCQFPRRLLRRPPEFVNTQRRNLDLPERWHALVPTPVHKVVALLHDKTPLGERSANVDGAVAIETFRLDRPRSGHKRSQSPAGFGVMSAAGLLDRCMWWHRVRTRVSGIGRPRLQTDYWLD